MLNFWRNFAIIFFLVAVAVQAALAADTDSGCGCCSNGDTTSQTPTTPSSTPDGADNTTAASASTPDAADSTSSSTPDGGEASTTTATSTPDGDDASTTTSDASAEPSSTADGSDDDDKTDALIKALQSLTKVYDKSSEGKNLKSQCDPSMASGNSGGNAPAGCSTFDKAAPAILDSFKTWSLNSTGQRAAVVALMAYESSTFTYNVAVNKEQANQGKGTYNLQSGPDNVEYAQALAKIDHQFGQVTDKNPKAVRDKLNSRDDWAFGSGAWYLSRSGNTDLAKDDVDQIYFKNYLTSTPTQGVGVPPNDEGMSMRLDIFNELLDQFKKNGI